MHRPLQLKTGSAAASGQRETCLFPSAPLSNLSGDRALFSLTPMATSVHVFGPNLTQLKTKLALVSCVAVGFVRKHTGLCPARRGVQHLRLQRETQEWVCAHSVEWLHLQLHGWGGGGGPSAGGSPKCLLLWEDRETGSRIGFSRSSYTGHW